MKILTLALVIFFSTLALLTSSVIKADTSQLLTFSSGLTLYSPLNTTYSTNIVECNGTLNWPKPYQLLLNYSIDGEDQGALLWNIDANSISIPEYTTIAGSFQLPTLSSGQHQLSIGINEAQFNNTGGTHELINRTTWVNTVTFTVNTSQPTPTLTQTPTPTSTSTPTVPEFSPLAILPLFVSILFIAVVLRYRKTKSRKFDGNALIVNNFKNEFE